ncbi:IS630 family transposase [Plantactinospora sp. KLBMP9567]|uniref:IS630 family transposase n=1 Tax=Plantactinospora sp. KLBMP9567 TaxID=3085900 RepID=UPI0029828B91|nr:IS630 family transposase [Plantactinospora sp. KLBMP9567]MDW5325671.1 IS630 family transposase [Plantactinospora sp. KLBMP9567]
MTRGRGKIELVLTDEERALLIRGARAAHSTQAYALRCRIVLACADGATNTEVAARFDVSLPTVGKWRSRFAAQRIAGLADKRRAGRPSVGADQVEQVLHATFESMPQDARRWSRASMAAHSGLSPSTVGRIWRRFDLKPHVQDGFTLATDPAFVSRVVDVVGLYHNPPDRAVVLCVDPRPPGRDRHRPQPATPATPRHPAADLWRPGPASRFGTFDPVDGIVTGQRQRRNRGVEYRRFLVAIERAVPAELQVHVVCDNQDLHRTPTVGTWLDRHPRFHVHFTPAGWSWLDQVERWFVLAVEDLLGPGGHPGRRPRNRDVRRWVATWAKSAEPFVWTRTAEDIRKSLAKFLERTSDAPAAAE